MLYGYLTISGDQADAEICSLCGFIAESDAWDNVDHAWRELLADSSGNFDAIACLRGTGVYQPWDILHRHTLLTKLSEILVRFGLAPVGIFVMQQDFWRLPPPGRAVLAAEDIDCPLDLMFSDLIERMICLVHEQSEKISLVIDQEPQSAAGQYNEFFNKHLGRYLLGRHLMGALAFAGAQDSMHLQAAKLLGEAVLLIEKRKPFSQQIGTSLDLPPALQQLGEQIYQRGRFGAVQLEGLIAKLKNARHQSETI